MTALGDGPATALDLSQRVAGVTYANARQILRRLAEAGVVTRLRRGLYAIDVGPIAEPSVVTSNGPVAATRSVLETQSGTVETTVSACKAAENQRGGTPTERSRNTNERINRAVAGAWAHFHAMNDIHDQDAWA